MDGYILITGGAGYIGSHVNKLLNKKGYETVVIDNLSNGHREFVKWGEFLLGDLKDKDFLHLVLSKYKIIGVMHFASKILVGESVQKPLLYYKENLNGFLNLIETLVEHNVRYFILSSTCAVYGPPKYVPIDENHPTNPINPYAKTKYMIEEMLKDISKIYDLKFVSLRYFNASGADFDLEIGEDHNPETHLIPIILDTLIGRRDKVTIFGNDYNTKDGTGVRDYIHVLDLAEAHIKALEYLMNGGESDFFNLGTGKSYTVLEVIEEVEKITKKKVRYEVGPRREGDVDILVSSTEKAQNILQWQPKYSDITTIISSAWEWHKKRFIT